MFCLPKDGEIWPLLLEKLYAKTYGNYSKIVVGYSADALRDLTGAPSEYIDIKDTEIAWIKMNKAL
jgi:hypothetical protein